MNSDSILLFLGKRRRPKFQRKSWEISRGGGEKQIKSGKRKTLQKKKKGHVEKKKKKKKRPPNYYEDKKVYSYFINTFKTCLDMHMLIRMLNWLSHLT